MTIPDRKNPNGGLRSYFFEKTPGIFRFATLPLEIPERPSFHRKFCKIIYTPYNFHGQKPRPIWKLHMTFSSILEIPLLS